MKASKIRAQHALPKGITEADIQPVTFDERDDAYFKLDWGEREFELWYAASTGWCIPTLPIGSSGSRSGRTGAQLRTYAVTVDGGRLVRIGSGPHVLETLHVYVRVASYKALKPFLELRTKGAADAGQVRDRISSRRAQGQLERASGRTSWRWDR